MAPATGAVLCGRDFGLMPTVSRGTAPLPRAPLLHPGSGCSHSWSIPRYMQYQALDLSPFHSSIRTINSLRPQGLCLFSFLCVLDQYWLWAWGSKETKELLVSLDAIRVGQDRDSHILYLPLFEKFHLIYLFLTSKVLNLYLSVAAPGYCLGGTWFFKNIVKYKIPQKCRILQSKI